MYIYIYIPGGVSTINGSGKHHPIFSLWRDFLLVSFQGKFLDFDGKSSFIR